MKTSLRIYMEIGKNTSQINLKLPSRLASMAKDYAEYYGFSNVQELIRESLREKIFSEEIREEYIQKIIKEEQKNEWIGKEKSEKLLLKLGKKALQYKNAK
jgi:Arc/MetJ-type ribon-helix-helix transcriptional regulator